MGLRAIYLCLAMLLMGATQPLWGQINLVDDGTYCLTIDSPRLSITVVGYDTYLWSNGDTGFTTAYDTTGEYWLQVTTNANDTIIDTFNLVLIQTPDAVFNALSSCATQTVNIIENSQPVTSTGTSWYWDFGNGDTSGVAKPSPVYTDPGTYAITLIVTNDNLCSDTSTQMVEIYPFVPVDARPDTNINIGELVQLTANLIGGASYVWTPDLFLSDDSIPNPVCMPNTTIEYTLTVTDTNGCMPTDTVLIEVNRPPVALNDDITLEDNDPTGLVPLNNDSDPNNDVLTITIIDSADHGTSVVVGDSIYYDPDQGYSGPDTIFYQICDEGNPPLCDEAYIAIFISNVKPDVIGENVTTTVNLGVSFDVLDNDSDPNGHFLTVVEISEPQNGTVTDQGFGQFYYEPDLGFTGVDSFYYIVCDDGLPNLCDTGWVVVNVVFKELAASNSITPNGNGQFDTFVIEGIRGFPGNQLIIFNRWGEVLFKQKDYQNDWNGEDGFSEPVPEGTYYFQLDLNDGSDPQTGWFYLKR